MGQLWPLFQRGSATLFPPVYTVDVFVEPLYDCRSKRLNHTLWLVATVVAAWSFERKHLCFCEELIPKTF